MESVNNNVLIRTENTKVQNKKKHIPIILGAGAVGWTITDMAMDLIYEKNRTDSFTKTMKNCAKSHTIGMKDIMAKITHFFTRSENLKNKISNISNKKFFAGLVVTDIIASYFALKTIENFRNNRNK